jgi:hypothetical protein
MNSRGRNKKKSVESRARPAHKGDKLTLTVICEPIVQTKWDFEVLTIR